MDSFIRVLSDQSFIILRSNTLHTMSRSDGELSVLKKCKALARQLGIETPLVLQSSLVKSPLLTGFFKPAGLIPEGMTVSNGFSSNNYLK